MPPATVYLVDDHAMMRDGLRAVLEQAGYEVVGESDDVVVALAALQALRPDVALVDINLGARSGLELLEQAALRRLSTRFVMLTMYDNPGVVAHALRAGAMGYVLKGSAAAEVVSAVAAVLAGQTYLGPMVAALAVRGLNRVHESQGLSSLSARERQVITLVVRGHSSASIAAELLLSPKTVESYRSRLMAKLGVTDLPALVRLAIREGLIGLDES